MYDFHQAQRRLIGLLVSIAMLSFLLGLLIEKPNSIEQAYALPIENTMPIETSSPTTTLVTTPVIFDLTQAANAVTSTVTIPITTITTTTTLVSPSTSLEVIFSDACKYDNTHRYTIEEGDTLYGIAFVYEVDIDDLIGCNRFVDGIDEFIYPGDVIILPPDLVQPTVATTTPPTTSEPVAAPTTASPVIAGSGTDTARQALLAVGATQSEIDFALPICMRESRCTLGALNQNSNTRDDSWGPWQINYYGNLIAREQTIGPRQSNTSSWEQAASNFLKLLRAGGRCHWTPPNYCR